MNLFRAFATVGSYTMLSRILGFARDILIAGTLGAGPVADAFFVAFKLPNFFAACSRRALSTPASSPCSRIFWRKGGRGRPAPLPNRL